MPCYDLIADVVLKFKSDAEKFYPAFYKLFDGTYNSPFQGLGYNCTLLLGLELCNQILAHLSGVKINNDCDILSTNHAITKFDKRQMAIISYLSGYVVSTFYRRLRFGKKQTNDHYTHTCLVFLSSCKLVEGKETDTSHHSLTSLRDRGGLWKVTYDTIRIFSIAESCFLSATKVFTTKIDASKLVHSLMGDCILLSYFGSLRSYEEKVAKEICYNLLEDMLTLYIRVRSHSYSKDKQQQHKIAKSTVKSRSLHTEIKKSSSSLDSGH